MSDLRIPFFLLLTNFAFLGTLVSSAADSEKLGKSQFEINCIACHQIDHMLVGPSLVEIATLYREDQAGFIKWCLQPGRKRPEAVEMPAMSHVGEENLKAIHRYILQITEGKEEKAVERKNFDPYPSLAKRPIVQRFFMPHSSPASIAVALPGGEGDLNFCFDTAECRLRYIWRNKDFMDRWPYWRSNGNAETKLNGPILYREDEPAFEPVKGDQAAKPEFLGYTFDEEGIPIFRYRRNGVLYTERITLNREANGFLRELTFPEKVGIKTSHFSSSEDKLGEATLEIRW